MNRFFLDCYIGISVVIAAIDSILAIKSSQKQTATGKYLALACACAALVDISYLISILTDSHLCMSVMSSVYFVTIDFMLLGLLAFTLHFIKGRFSKTTRRLMILGNVYALFELVVFALNPFLGIAVDYIPRNTEIARYAYQMKPLYISHLVFSYVLVGTVIFLLVWKLCQVPREYRNQYRFVIVGILAIVAVNAVFLFCHSDAIWDLLDYSICGYSLTSYLLYWSCFNYSSRGMLNTLKTSIFENVGQGVVLFDYDNHLILHNRRADELLGESLPGQCQTLQAFLVHYDLPEDAVSQEDSISLQCYVKREDQTQHPLRCDIRCLKNDRGQQLGQLFVFSDAELETDLLTGFQNWESFQLLAQSGQNAFPVPMAVAVCDINSLSVINSTLGTQAGNQQIRTLAGIMRKNFPKQTYFVRGVEANLIALCAHSTEAAMQSAMGNVSRQFSGSLQYAVSTTAETTPDVLEAVSVAIKAMRAKKLLDQKSIRSEMLASLIQALQECDSDTEHHVRRTQALGSELGKRIHLSDHQQSQLSLLCLLHDIGKIGVPLEILNKPGKLTADEWAILKTHAVKGYEIANSNNELRGIADEIRHHHERWDGTGYPDGLSRESIPLLSRIIAVVDAYDAMTNNRSYRRAMHPEAAIAELRRCAGSQFDPFIVSEFIQMFREHPEMQVSNADSDSSAPRRFTLDGEPAVPEKPEALSHIHPVPYSRYTLDSDLRIVETDENFEKMTGYSRSDVQSRKMRQTDLIPEEERTEYLCWLNAGIAKNSPQYLEHRIRRKDGGDIYVFCFGRVYFDSAVRTERTDVVIVDISKTYSMKSLMEAEADKAQIRLKYWENTYRRDPLTGLLNHAAFRSDVELQLLDGKSKVMMLMLDVDKFKQYNDTQGHQSGDQFLILVAQALSGILRKEDSACRMGGDEFAAALFFKPGTPDSVLVNRAQQIYDSINLTLKGADGRTGISMGAAIARPDTGFSQLYEQADQALYRAKEGGRSRLSF